MIVVYTPASGGEPEHYDANSLKVSEASIVQRTVDMKWQEIKGALEADDLDAMRGIVWVIKKRSNPALRFGEFDPGVDEMTSRMDNKEVAAYVDDAFRAPDRDPDITREMVADILMGRLPDAAVDPEYTRALIAEKAKDPKETAAEADSSPLEEPAPAEAESLSPSPTSSLPETSTSDSSLTSSTSLPEMSTT